MILKALVDYYDRKVAAAAGSVAPRGFEYKEIRFVLVVNPEGALVAVEDTREGEGRRLRAKRFLVPQAVKKTSGVQANLLWDTAEYVLGVDLRGKPARAREQHNAFAKRLDEQFGDEPMDPAVRAVCAFIRSPEKELAHRFGEAWAVVREANPLVTFRLAGDPGVVSERSSVRAMLEEASPRTGPVIVCSVTGERDVRERVHPAIKGVRDAKSTGANIVSFNEPAFSSFGNEQGENAPIGKNAVFRYTTALNHLLSRDSRQKIQIGDATVVFWAERASGGAAEEAFRNWFEIPPDDPDRRAERVRALLAMQQGSPLTSDDDQRFHVLGLSPNVARLAVRFWHVATIRQLGARVFAHFEALRIDRGNQDEEFPTISSLLLALAAKSNPKEKRKKVPPNLAGDWMRAILAGTPYPLTVLQCALRRARAEQGVGYRRAAVIKACLHQMTESKEEKPTVSLDIHNPNAAYRLGRLFAVLERIQEESSPGLNATIRDRYFGASSSTPRTVFPILNRLKNHHLAKLDNRGRAVNLERLVGEIVDGLDASNPFPASLSLVDQGRFAVGYYHQRQHPSTYRTGGND